MENSESNQHGCAWECLSSVPEPWAVSLVCVGFDVQHGMQLLGRVPQQALKVTHEAVHIAFPCRLVNDVFVIIVAKATAQLLVIHLGFVFPFAPSPGHLT